MSTTTAPARPHVERPRRFGTLDTVERKGNILVKWITSTDHKTIGYLYLITSFIYFCIGGVMALIIRAELFEPGLQIVQTREQYNQLFTMHGTIMLLHVRDAARSPASPTCSCRCRSARPTSRSRA